jgi:asparaginyl-tRNA synthetase
MSDSIDTTVDRLAEHAGQAVRLRGWVYGLRRSGKVAFLELRDGTGICQCIVEASAPEAFEAAGRLTQESSLALTGTVRPEPRAPGGYEIAVVTLEPVHIAEDYPITRKAHGWDFLFSHRHLWFRSRRPTAILRIRHTLIRACREFFDNRGFTLVDTPILVPGAGEDTQTLFPVTYFDRQAYLAQTGQLYLESACMALGKVYCFGPTFRAEKSKTRRHLTEFWMIEPEIAFADLDDVIALAEDFMVHLVERVLAANTADLESLGRDVEALRLIRKPFPRMTYDQAVENLRSEATRQRMEARLEQARAELAARRAEQGALTLELESAKQAWKQDKARLALQETADAITDLEREVEYAPEHIRLAQAFEWGGDLGGSDESVLSRQFDRPLFVTDYPAEAKAFYMKRHPHDPRRVRNMDLLAPEGYGEIIGGSQREDDIETLRRSTQEKGLRPEDYDWYFDLRRFGSVPHGGFGLGIERTLTWICGLKHVRETIPFPRTMGKMVL